MMVRYNWVFLSTLLLLALAAGCGGGKNNKAAAGTSTGGGGQGASSEGEAGTATDMDSGTKVKSKTCGDKVVEPPEECDDGNGVENDGCDTLCKFNCKSDTDCTSQKDVCSGGTMKCNTDKHVCEAGSDKKADGESCGDNAWCYQGKCYPLQCGNGIKQGNEECDDGNSNDADGCTKKCAFTCVAGDKVNPAINMCDPTATCDGATHTWKTGKPLPDKTLCARGAGYCSNGVCVYSVCGDGTKDPNEECDEGTYNGKEGSKCLATCTTSVCGNGKIEGLEQCDDGNNTNLDGCEANCKAEVTFRGTRLVISTEEAPEYCVHSKKNDPSNVNAGNAFRNMFPIDPSTGTNGILDLVNNFIQGAIDEGRAHTLFNSIDIDDYSGKVPDPSAYLGLSIGEYKTPDAWPTDPTQTLDTEFYAYSKFFNEKREPLSIVPGETLLENGVPVVRSTVPVSAGFDVLGNEYKIRHLVARIEVDGKFSKLPSPPTYVSTFTAPESVGKDGPLDNPMKDATGVLCGAFHETSFNAIPLVDMFNTLCVDQWGQYRSCGSPPAEGTDAGAAMDIMGKLKRGECDSMLTVFQGGCSVAGLVVLEKLGPADVDSDGDGKNDSWSCVVRVSAKRVKVIGIKDAPDGGPI